VLEGAQSKLETDVEELIKKFDYDKYGADLFHYFKKAKNPQVYEKARPVLREKVLAKLTEKYGSDFSAQNEDNEENAMMALLERGMGMAAITFLYPKTALKYSSRLLQARETAAESRRKKKERRKTKKANVAKPSPSSPAKPATSGKRKGSADKGKTKSK